MFSIGFTDEAFERVEPDEQGRMGLLLLGKHEERFVTHFWTWSEAQYLDQWKSGLARVLLGKPAALITDMRTPVQSSHLVWWPMWKIEREVIFHNQLFFFSQHKLPGPHVEMDVLYNLIGRRLRESTDGTPISEWTVDTFEIEKFLTKWT